MNNLTGRLSITASIAILCILISLSCIFDPDEPSVPGFPSKIDAEIAFGSIGSPHICKCMNDHDLALIAAGSRLAIVDIVNGDVESTIDLQVEIDDIADSDMNGFGYVLADSLLYPVNLSGALLEDPINLRTSCSYVSVSAGKAWVSMDNDSIGSVDLSSGILTVVKGFIMGDCQGIAAAADGLIYFADGDNDLIIGFDILSWSEVGRVSVPGDVIDLFPGPSGYICAIVNGSNELWYIKSESCTLYKMITFPVIPVSAATMPDGNYAYGSCPGAGFLIIAESGQCELRTMDFGIPSSMDVSSDGDRAVICSPEKETVYILVK
jgi:hypothetical protein